MESQGTNKDGYFLFNKLIINDIYCVFFALYFLGLLSDAETAAKSAAEAAATDTTAQ